jgi:hypothetical protein
MAVPSVRTGGQVRCSAVGGGLTMAASSADYDLLRKQSLVDLTAFIDSSRQP